MVLTGLKNKVLLSETETRLKSNQIWDEHLKSDLEPSLKAEADLEYDNTGVLEIQVYSIT